MAPDEMLELCLWVLAGAGGTLLVMLVLAARTEWQLHLAERALRAWLRSRREER